MNETGATPRRLSPLLAHGVQEVSPGTTAPDPLAGLAGLDGAMSAWRQVAARLAAPAADPALTAAMREIGRLSARMRGAGDGRDVPAEGCVKQRP